MDTKKKEMIKTLMVFHVLFFFIKAMENDNIKERLLTKERSTVYDSIYPHQEVIYPQVPVLQKLPKDSNYYIFVFHNDNVDDVTCSRLDPLRS